MTTCRDQVIRNTIPFDRSSARESFPQGLKPMIPAGLGGTAEAVPFPVFAR
jgi:hypothetical protein